MSETLNIVVDSDPLGEQIRKAFLDKDLPNIYFNGFTSMIGSGDMTFILTRNERPIATLNMSYTVAKTFVHKLNDLIVTLENATKNTIMTVDVIKESMGAEKRSDVSSK